MLGYAHPLPMDAKYVAKLLIGVVAAALVVYLLSARISDLRANVSRRDSLAYWAAGQQLILRQNPYDTNSILLLQGSQGYAEAKPLILRTPPWSLFLTLPLGLMNSFWSWVVWVVVLLVALIFSVRICWRIYGENARAPTFFSLVAYLFAPVPACLVAGQMGLLLLVGMVLFLLLERDRPFLAGAALILPFAKPHLLLLFWVSLASWLVFRRKWTLATGFLTALATTSVLALVFDPAVFQHYRAMLVEASIGHEFIPALSGVLRLLFFRRFFWAQFVPMVLGLIWVVWLFWKDRYEWEWRQHGPLVMVVSVLTTPYAWPTDEVVLLPAVLQAFMCIYTVRAGLAWTSKLAIAAFTVSNLLLLLILRAKVPFASGIYSWSSLVWFAWYLYGRSFRASAAPQTARVASQ